jgi:cell division protein FtsA
VIGIVGYYEGDKFHIQAYHALPHKKRAMLNGQIHDIPAVSRVIREVKKNLEAQIGFVLTDVAIAAAGRVLTTEIVEVTTNFEEIHEIVIEDIEKLELQGVQEAQKQLEKKGISQNLCVGHTVMQYTLDNYELLNLQGHKGREIYAKVLATFLPSGVVESLYAVTEQAGLKVAYLTLEPIAAIHAMIPQDLRLLNIGLVDVGAGTSDIAITKEGSIVAYGMIATAGDEITESILKEYLVDFQTAENIKHQLSLQQELIYFEDILGVPQEVKASVVATHIHKDIQALAEQIGNKIKELNGNKSTNAIFCVGGGSQIVGFPKYLATYLDLSEQRISVRRAEQIEGVVYPQDLPTGPEMITPIGICLTALRNKQKHLCELIFNGQSLEILASTKLTVLDVMIYKGILPEQLFAVHGKSLLFKINNQRFRLKGHAGQPATLLKNGQIATLQDEVCLHDEIEIAFAHKGEDAKAYLKDYLKEEKQIFLDDQPCHLPFLMVNGQSVSSDYRICDKDDIHIHLIETLEDLLLYLYGDNYLDVPMLVNDQQVNLNYILHDGDQLTRGDFIPNYEKDLEDNLKKIVEEIKQDKSTPKNLPAEDMWVIVNNKRVELPYQEEEYIVAKIFDHIDFDLSKPQGHIKLLLNKKETSVMEVLHKEDIIDIFWEK